MDLEPLYQSRCSQAWSINEHLGTLRRYARDCDHVVEFGVDNGFSTIAFLAGLADQPERPRRLEGWDLRRVEPDISLIEAHARDRGIDYSLHVGSSLDARFEGCDLLFIDSLHTYAHVKEELFRHGWKARKFLLLHDTEGGAWVDEGGGDPPTVSVGTRPQGIRPALDEFLAAFPHWTEHEHFPYNHGLTVLIRAGVSPPPGP
jgi:hypothetical protein